MESTAIKFIPLLVKIPYMSSASINHRKSNKSIYLSALFNNDSVLDMANLATPYYIWIGIYHLVGILEGIKKVSKIRFIVCSIRQKDIHALMELRNESFARFDCGRITSNP